MKNKWIKACCLSMAVLIMFVTAMCFINPTTAHNDNKISWNGLIKEKTEFEDTVSSNWLSKDGQTVIINNYSKEYNIPITIISNKDISGAIITAVSENAEVLSTSLSQDKLDLKANQEQTVNLDMTVINTLEDTLGNVSDTLSSITEQNTENPTDSSADEIETTSIAVKVECVYGTEKLSANLVVPVNEKIDNDLAEGDLNKIQSQYNKELPINVSTGSDKVAIKLNDGSFPSKTKYTIDGKATTLFDEGIIQLDADKSVELDLSETDVSGNLVINTTQKSYDLSDTALVLNIDNKSFIIKDNLELPVNYLWGSLEPKIEIEHLTVNEDKLSWTETKLLTIEKSPAGKLLLKNTNAEAGTYRITVSWIENDITLYKIEVPFFVRYDSAALGGTGQ